MEFAASSLRARLKNSIDTRTLFFFALLLPAVTIVFLYRGLPILYNVYISVQEREVGGESTFVGLEHYSRMVNDPIFWDSLFNTLLFFGTIPVGIAIALGLALLLNEQFPGNTIFRSIFFLPYITMMVAVGVIWTFMYTQDGIVNVVLQSVGIIDEPITWLGHSNRSRLAVFLTHVWKTIGFYLIVILAGMQTIPAHLYEVAKIDRASRWQRFRYVTLPLLKPTLGVCALIGLATSFELFDLIMVMTDGGPGTSTEILITYLYKQAFRFGNLGYGAAITVVLFVLTVVLVLVVSPKEGY